MAHQDPLTQLGNRGAYDHAVETEVYRADRHKTPLSMLVIDIDFFKRINDDYGHLVGDQVLKKVAQMLNAQVRKSDLAFRYGGEEFVILMTNTHSDAAHTIAERIRSKIAAAVVNIMEQTIPVTVSIGVSEFQHGESASTLFHRADQALYQAKHDGRNQVKAA